MARTRYCHLINMVDAYWILAIIVIIQSVPKTTGVAMTYVSNLFFGDILNNIVNTELCNVIGLSRNLSVPTVRYFCSKCPFQRFRGHSLYSPSCFTTGGNRKPWIWNMFKRIAICFKYSIMVFRQGTYSGFPACMNWNFSKSRSAEAKPMQRCLV
jgi:hypothetical protein